jgi:hypothetical protein
MEPSDISLETMNKLFEYEKHSRLIDGMNTEELRNFAKLYCKLYLKQQEVISTMNIESRI